METLELDALMIRHRAVMECIRDFDDPLEALCAVLIPSEEVLKASLESAIMRGAMSGKSVEPERAGAVSATKPREVVGRQSRVTPARKISWMKR